MDGFPTVGDRVKPRLAQSNSGADAQRTYLTKLVEEAIKIDLQEGRYLALASSTEYISA